MMTNAAGILQRPLAPGIHEMLASNTLSNTLLLERHESELLRTTRFQYDHASTLQRLMRTRAAAAQQEIQTRDRRSTH
jgi:hypothetical protein